VIHYSIFIILFVAYLWRFATVPMNLLQHLRQKLHEALGGLVADPTPYSALVKPAQDARHGDYQANAAMSLAKVLGRPPRDVAQQIIHNLSVNDLMEAPEVAGPGFINFRLRREWLADHLRRLAADPRLGVQPTQPARTLVIDYSSPNVAKPMHVGHLRSTIIGDALVRLFRFLGHRVITDNHLGDWGTQFGMILYGYKHFRDEEALKRDPVRELARLYVHVRGLMKANEDDEAEDAANPVAVAARQETAKLHAGDPENVRLWQMFIPWCLREIEQMYQRLDVHFDHMHGESFYQPMLADVVGSLEEKGIARPSQGALALFREDGEFAGLVRKRDGAYTYTTTDLATIRYRMEQWHPDAILYVVGAPQALHFKNFFAAARRWGYDKVALEHIAFGSVLGEDRKLFGTRKGNAVELGALLDEAVARGERVYEQLQVERRERGEEVPELGPDERREVAEAVGLGAVKYADLSQNRTSDYVFNWDKMMKTDGDTATYMQYAYARNRSIFRKGEEDPSRFRTDPPPVTLEQPVERALAVQLVRFDETLAGAAAEYKPNLITAYLYDLAKSYSRFNQTCQVLKAETPALRQSRLLLCDLTARVIQEALQLLGIRTLERM
jgi:arginyl-tRNA synthetase